jgi:hypothetical protein
VIQEGSVKDYTIDTRLNVVELEDFSAGLLLGKTVDELRQTHGTQMHLNAGSFTHCTHVAPKNLTQLHAILAYINPLPLQNPGQLIILLIPILHLTMRPLGRRYSFLLHFFNLNSKKIIIIIINEILQIEKK